MADVPFPYIPALNAIGHTALQLVVGSSLGVVVDTAMEFSFNYAGFDDRSADAEYNKGDPITDGLELAAVAARVSLQVLITGVAVGVMMNMLAATSVESADPSGGAVFALVLFRSQRNLGREVDRLLRYVGDMITRLEIFAAFEYDTVVGGGATSTVVPMMHGRKPGTARTHHAGVVLDTSSAQTMLLRRKNGVMSAQQM